ncbi:MAG: WbqC family protein [Bacteroidota bacterium]
MKQVFVIPSLYLPPGELLSSLCGQQVVIDVNALWTRGKLSNRAHIVGPNGLQELIVPVVNSRAHIPINQIRVSYSDNWIRVHIGALEAAYNSSPFFPLFRDELFSALRSKPEFLHELNHRVNQALYRAAGIQVNSSPEESADFITLNVLSHEEIASLPHLPPYPQPFGHKHGYRGGLSGVDLISCLGRLPTR